MKRDRESNLRIKKYIIAATGIVGLLVIFCCISLFLQGDKPETISDCPELIPEESPLVLPNERSELCVKELDFKEKERLSYGKDGFRYKIDIKETSILMMDVWEDSTLKNISYGVYRSSELGNPVAEVHIEEVLKMDLDSALGNLTEIQPKHQPREGIVLKPGVYYIAVYSKNSNEDAIAKYESLLAVVNTELSLQEGEWGFFFSTGKEQKTYFEVNVPGSGMLYVDRDFWRVTYDIQLCDAEKNSIQKPILEPSGQEKGHQKAKFSVSESGVYYLQVVSDDSSPSCWANEIRYRFVSE